MESSPGMFTCCKKSNEPDDESREFLETIKLLLLGTGESGKTTIIKQMKILHINGFSESEKKEKIFNVKQNIHESIYDILFNMDKIDPPIEIRDENVLNAFKFIMDLGQQMPEEFTEEYYDNVKLLWADSGVQETFQRSNEFQLIDSAEHFLNQIDKIRQPDYMPTTQDILFCRVTTKAISKIEFKMSVPKSEGGGSAKFWMFDVGGQRGERRKWIRVFEDIEAILFLIAASDFDQTLREDTKKNRLEESFSLFETICYSQFVRKSGLIVFLNKQDLLKRKIEQGRKLEKYFPDFQGFIVNKKDGETDNEYDRARLYMKKKLLDIAGKEIIVEHMGLSKNIKAKLPPRQPYIHFTTATDTNNIKKVFDSVRTIILQNLLNQQFY